jgi:myosin heavy subunit
VIPRLSKTSFIVCHTAKDVEYEVNGFKLFFLLKIRDKNKDEISIDIIKMMIES